MSKEYTVEIETKNGYIDYLIMQLEEDQNLTDELVEDEFDLYKNDEAGEHLKNDSLEMYSIIRID